MSQRIRIEWKGGQGQNRSTWAIRGLALGTEEVRAAPGGKIMVKMPSGNTLTILLLPWDSCRALGLSLSQPQLPDEKRSLGAGLS